MNKKALFFLYHYNDIDHITPVIHKWASSSKTFEIEIIFWDQNKKYLEDYRILFLINNMNVTIHHIDEFFSSEELKSIKQIASLSQHKYGRVFRMLLKSILFLKRAFKIAYILPRREIIQSDAFAERLISVVFGETKKGVVVFDWTAAATNKIAFFRALMHAAHKNFFLCVSLPHGDSPYANKLFRTEDINYISWSRFANAPFDHVVVPNELTAKRYLPALNKKRVHILGSPRYNQEWR